MRDRVHELRAGQGAGLVTENPLLCPGCGGTGFVWAGSCRYRCPHCQPHKCLDCATVAEWDAASDAFYGRKRGVTGDHNKG